MLPSSVSLEYFNQALSFPTSIETSYVLIGGGYRFSCIGVGDDTINMVSSSNVGERYHF